MTLIYQPAQMEVNGLGIESTCGQDIPHSISRPWGPPCFLYDGYQLFSGVNSGQVVRLTTPPSSAVLKKEQN
jgi:hypothetical protein